MKSFLPPAHSELPDILPESFVENTHDRARWLFEKALAEDVQEVLESLEKDVLPSYLALSPEIAKRSFLDPTTLRQLGSFAINGMIHPEFEPQDGLPVRSKSLERGANRSPEALQAYKALENWTARFELRDEWLRDLAVATLYGWAVDKRSKKPITRRWRHLPEVTTVAIYEGPNVEFVCPGWDLGRESWPEFLKRARKLFNDQLDSYRRDVTRSALDGGWDLAPDIREQQRFRWLAWYQTLGWSASTILNCKCRGLDVTENNVLKQIQISAQQATVTLRPSRKGRTKQNRN